jgi:hypothetical protein
VADVNPVLLAASGLGHGDCEAIRDGLLGQPVNALTSLAFLAAGVWIARRGRRVPLERAELVVFGLVVASNALGSFLFHGPRPLGSRWLHDLSALAVPLFVSVHDLGLVRGWPVGSRVRWFAAGLVVVGGVLAWPGALVPLGFLAAAAAGTGELFAFRAGYRPRPGRASRAQLAAWGVGLFTLALAGLAFLFGRSDSPLCEPRSVVQLHGGWHLLVALASMAWALAAFELRGAPPEPADAGSIAPTAPRGDRP